MFLNTRNPAVSDSRLATPTGSTARGESFRQAMTLKWLPKAFGEGQQNKLDALTVTLSHPDGQQHSYQGNPRLRRWRSAVQYQQLRNPAVHTVPIRTMFSAVRRHSTWSGRRRNSE
jgi:NitT/TauT family transport system substrate-binding protein